MKEKNLLHKFLGDTYPLAVHLVQMTSIFVLLLFCIYLARTLIPLLFPSGEYLTNLLHLVDVYAAHLGIIGYIVWLTLDMSFLVIEHGKKTFKRRGKEENGNSIK